MKHLRKKIRNIIEKQLNATPIIKRGFSTQQPVEELRNQDYRFFAGNLDLDDMLGNKGTHGKPLYIENEEKNNDIKTLNFFDFDGTLIDTMEEEEGKKKYKEITGEEYPFETFWDIPESLTTFENKPIQFVVDQYKNKKDIPGSFNVLLTNRSSKVEKEIKTILDVHSLSFDDYNFRDLDVEKPERIKQYLDRFKGVKNINVYDDREDQIALFKQLKNELKSKGVFVNIFKVSKK